MNTASRSTAVLVIFLALLSLTCSVITGSNDEDESSEEREPLTEDPNRNSTIDSTRLPSGTGSNTFFIRLDGGSPEQCTGISDAPYPGSGVRQPCAWDHPFRALPPEGGARIRGGDRLIIESGSYMMGLGAPGSEACNEDYSWDCFMISVPSGSSAAPTQILGAGWDSGCANPPELWGTQRASTILNLQGSSHVELACLDITDHSGCAEDHTGGLACQRDTFPYGDWADTGLYAEDSANVTLNDLNIHGLAVNGALAGRLADWTVENVRIASNGLAGWDGDIEGDDANHGVLTFRNWTVEWNGCPESYPEKESAGCWGQSAGGYGDGIGTGETGGIWIIEDSRFLHNSSDGLDLLYTRLEGSEVIIRRTISAGNAGDQIKTTGPTALENVIAVSSCGFFSGQPFTHGVDHCRAGGSAIALNPRLGNQITILNSTITGQGDCLVIAECGDESGCSGSETILIRNSILLGNPEFDAGGDDTCLAWSGMNHDPFIYDHDILSYLKAMPDSCPASSLCNIDAGLVEPSINAFDASLTSESVAIDAGTVDAAPADDFFGASRDSIPDIGAIEYQEP